MSDDFSSNTSTTGRLTVGGLATGSMEYGSDEDWFRVSLQAGQTYLFSMSGMLQGAGSLYSLDYTTLRIFDTQGKYINLGNYLAMPSMPMVLQFTPASSGDYYLGAYTYDSRGTGTYTVSATVQVPDALPSDTSATAVLLPGQTVVGVFEQVGDRDWYKFHAEAGQHYKFTTPKGDGMVQVSAIDIYDSNGTLLPQSSYPFEPLVSGDYFVSAAGFVTGTYQLKAGIIDDDYPSNASTSAVLQPGLQFSGALQYIGDTDSFRAQLQGGRIYTFEVRLDPLDKANVHVFFFDAAGNNIAASKTMTADGYRLTFAPQTSGEYLLRLEGHSSYNWNGLTHGPYTLSMQNAVVQDDYADVIAGAAPLKIGNQLSGQLQSSADVDMMRVSLTAGVTYAFQLQHPDSPGIKVTLLDATGNSLLRPAAGREGYFSYTPASSGEFYLAISSESGVTSAGAYTIRALQPADDFSANQSGAGTLRIGSAIGGTLEAGAGDRDWFAVTLTAGDSYIFTLNGAPEKAGTLEPGVWGGLTRLIDSSGKELVRAQGDNYHTGSLLAYSPTVSGTYYVEVSSPGGMTGTYQLLARGGPHDDFGDDIAHATVLQNGVAVQGRLESGLDMDVFRLDLKADSVYAIDLRSAYADGSWMGNVQLSVSDSSGRVVSGWRDGAAQAQELYRTFSALSAGSYYITVSHGASDLPRDYVLLATRSELDDYNGDSGTKGVLPENGSVSGVIGIRGDEDWIKVRLEAGKTYQFSLDGSGSSALKVGDGAAMVLHHSGGGPLLASAALDADGRLVMSYQSSYTMDYYVGVKGGAYSTGSYLLSGATLSYDTTAPTISAFPNASTEYGLQEDIVLTFSEAIRQSVNGYISLIGSDGQSVMVWAGSSSKGYVEGAKLIIHHPYALKLGMSYTISLSDGLITDLGGNAYTGQKTFTFHTASWQLDGSPGNDILKGSGAGQSIAAGDGLDTVVYDGGRSHYSISTATGQLLVNYDASGNRDVLSGVERLHFTDVSVALDVDGTGGQAYRLYQAAFDRTPDQTGLGFWISVLDRGIALDDAAQGFIDSQEFRSLYGAASSDSAFVAQLYHNVLHRDGDAGGLAFWQQILHDGHSRAAVLAAFSESPENQAALAGVIGNGFDYVPYG